MQSRANTSTSLLLSMTSNSRVSNIIDFWAPQFPGVSHQTFHELKSLILELIQDPGFRRAQVLQIHRFCRFLIEVFQKRYKGERKKRLDSYYSLMLNLRSSYLEVERSLRSLLCLVFLSSLCMAEGRNNSGDLQQTSSSPPKSAPTSLDYCSSHKSVLGLRLALHSVLHPHLVGVPCPCCPQCRGYLQGAFTGPVVFSLNCFGWWADQRFPQMTLCALHRAVISLII